MFKKIGFLCLGLPTLFAFSASTSFAVSLSATPARILLASTTVTPAAWVPVVTSTTKSVKGVIIASTASSSAGTLGDLALGIAAASAGAGTEVAQMVIPATTLTTAVYYPMVMSGATRISIESKDLTLSKGEFVINVIYN